MNYEKKLFDAVEKLGEILEGDLHIIDSSETYPYTEGDGKYRVYHKNGYCFDVQKEWIEDEDCGTDKGHWEYTFSSEWDGFKKLDARSAYAMIKINTVEV